MPEYKLIYFHGRGAAEICRLVFAAAGVEYIDERVTRQQWAGIMADQPMQKLPVLEIDGVTFCQSTAIARYLAREFGLAGSSNIESLLIDELIDATVELEAEFVKIYREPDNSKKDVMRKAVAEEHLARFMAYFEKRLDENNGGVGFFLGENLTLGDLIVYSGLAMSKDFLGDHCDVFAHHLKLKAHYCSIEAVPNISNWLRTRPVTDL